MAEQTTPGAPILDIGTRLAFERTRAAYERTMMSWIRTAASLITFGFSVYKFFQLEKPASGSEQRLVGPRGFALTLVSVGLVSLALATLDFRQNIRTLGAQYGGRTRSLSVVMAGLISLLGILAFIVMIFRE
jgi:putative membrane protein